MSAVSTEMIAFTTVMLFQSQYVSTLMSLGVFLLGQNELVVFIVFDKGAVR